VSTSSPTNIPYPFDHYHPWQPATNVDEFQVSLILGAYPPGAKIVEVSSYRPGYMNYPFRVKVQLSGGQEEFCVLKADPLVGGVEREGNLLPVLAHLGLPVPSVLAGPRSHPDYPNGGALTVLSEIPGKPLPWGDVTLAEADFTCRLHQEAVTRLHQLTEQVLRDKVAQELPKKTLRSELEGIVSRGGPWLQVPTFLEAVKRLQPTLESIQEPLVFSNGDYNPLNFLHDGENLTGWIDFTGACFEDPLVGFAKFVIWAFDTLGWGVGSRAGLVERYLYSQDLSRSDFAPRLVLRCLWRLQRDTSVANEQDAYCRQAMLSVLRESFGSLEDV
jgi:aminoglycoside phosphotransferase